MTTRRAHALAATTDAVSWELFEYDGFNVPRIDIVFASAPVSAGTVQITKDSVLGADYDVIIRTENPVGLTAMSFEGLQGFVQGDKVLVGYDNPDNVSITGSASLELTHVAPGLAEGGLTADGGKIRSLSATYAHYYHIALGSSAPGASGATWVPANANQLAGYRLDADTEKVSAEFDIHSDWDNSYNPTLEVGFTVNVDNSLGAVDDTVDLQVIAHYLTTGDSVVKTQTVDQSVTVGACDQYTTFHADIELDRDATDNPISPGSWVSITVTCEATGDVTDIVVNGAAAYYPTTAVGIELETV